MTDGIDESGFFKLPENAPIWKLTGPDCRHPEHDPPSHLRIPEGQGYRHVCPACGAVAVQTNPIKLRG